MVFSDKFSHSFIDDNLTTPFAKKMGEINANEMKRDKEAEKTWLSQEFRRLLVATWLAVSTIIYASNYVRAEEIQEEYFLFDDLADRYEAPTYSWRLWDLDIEQLKNQLLKEWFDEDWNPVNNISDIFAEHDVLKNPNFQKTLEKWLISIYEDTWFEFKWVNLILFVKLYQSIEHHDYLEAANYIKILKEIYSSWVPNFEYAIENIHAIPTEA